MEREAFLQNYWNYYLVLENRFINAVNYVALNSDNYNTYSFEFVNLILLIGSELDVTMKYLSGISEGDRASIQNYADKIFRFFTVLPSMVRSSYILTPPWPVGDCASSPTFTVSSTGRWK